MYEIKTAGPSDTAIIQQLAFDTWPSAYGSILSGEQISYMLSLFYSESSLLRQMQDQGHRFYMLYKDNNPVGFASCSPKAGGEEGLYRLHKLYVLPLEQGLGIGQKLLEHVINSIRSESGTALELNVNRYNKARMFYEKMGFHVTHEEDIDIGNGYWMNDYVMRKELPALVRDARLGS